MGARCCVPDGGDRGLLYPEDTPTKDFADLLLPSSSLPPSNDRRTPRSGSARRSDDLNVQWGRQNSDVSTGVRSFAQTELSRATGDNRFYDAVSTVASETEIEAKNGDAGATSDAASESDCGSENSQLSTTSGPICNRKSSLGAGSPYLAVQNPGDINNVYTFSKNLLALADIGAMGQIWKATVKVTGAVRAVKFIPKSLTVEKMASVRRHIGITATFDHPNLVSLHELFEDSEFVHIVLDHCSGGSLQNRLDKQGAFPELKAVIVMQQVFRAVNYLHTKKICHRDVQPQNILFTDAVKDIDDSCVIKVSGFNTLCSVSTRKKFFKKVSHPDYMAPEINVGRYGIECDLWSCGVVLFEILCERLPFPDEEELHEMTEVNFNGHESVSNTARDLISLLLEVNPRARYNINQVLHHKWLAKAAPKPSSVPLDATTLASTLARLKAFRLKSKFHQAALRMVVNHLSEHDVESSHKLFLFLDKDGDGKIMPLELESIIAMDPQISNDYPDISELFQNVDINDPCRQEAFTYTEFVAATFDKKLCLTEDVCRLVFSCFDKNGDGFISHCELAAGHLLDDLSLEELGMTVEDVDRNGDHAIDFEEFMLTIRKEPS